MLKKLLVIAFAVCSSWAFAATDANKASVNELTGIKGIGPATAERIIEARKQAPFKNWDDFIQRIKGVAPTSASHLSTAGLTINGQSFKPATSAAPAPTASIPADKAAKPVQASGKKDNKG
ncbi:MAG: helix-hairpin-helix domain-containing protein [Comamonas sp.]|nr:helix-hairpin-helix domain-containing protein [Candidatus Comamonas equi]